VESKVAIDTFREVFEVVANKGWTPDVTHGYAAKMMAKHWKPSYVNYMRVTKKALDPNNIMNPGVWGEVI
jgi:FAD/FMN-containing dehydrogenase